MPFPNVECALHAGPAAFNFCHSASPSSSFAALILAASNSRTPKLGSSAATRVRDSTSIESVHLRQVAATACIEILPGWPKGAPFTSFCCIIYAGDVSGMEALQHMLQCGGGSHC